MDGNFQHSLVTSRCSSFGCGFLEVAHYRMEIITCLSNPRSSTDAILFVYTIFIMLHLYVERVVFFMLLQLYA